jgi:hypothetical protein
LADVRESIHVSGPEDEAGAKLERVLAEFVLRMAGSTCSLPRFRIVAAQKMKEISGLQFRGAIGLPQLVNQKRERNAGLFPKLAGIDPVSQSYGCECCSLIAKSLGVLAQLRGMLAAKNSSIMAQENNHRELFVPQRSEPDFASVAIRERDEGQLAAERTVHDASIMSSALRGVKHLPRAGCGVACFHELWSGKPRTAL